MLMLVGCSTVPKKVLFPNVHPKLKSYVKRFNMLSKGRVPNDIIVKLGVVRDELPRPDCPSMYQCIKNETTISAKHWPKMKLLYREEVIFHELGHHVLKLNHDWLGGNMLKNGCPRSLMFHQGAYRNNCYKRFRRYHIKSYL